MPGPRRLVTAAALALACAGCGPSPTGNQVLPDGPTGTEPPAPSPVAAATTAAPSPTAAVDHADVLAVYRGWWTALEGAYAAATPTTRPWPTTPWTRS